MTVFQRRGPFRGEGPHKIARSIGLVVLLAVLTTPVAGHAGPMTKPSTLWHVSRSPKLRVDVAAGCPAAISAYQDVVNTFPGPPLVPPGPDGAIVCRYLGPSAPRQLARQTRLDEEQAQLLSEVVRRLSLQPPEGITMCPADFNANALIGFSYRGRPDVGLWYHASGCQSLDNGRIGSFETANPSFYNGFLVTVDRLSPLPKQST